MFTLTVLASGSAGNCALVATEQCRLLVDAGISARQLVLRLERAGICPEQLDGILLTHEHGDHTAGLEVLCRKFESVPVYGNAATAGAVRYAGSLQEHRNWRVFPTGRDFQIGDIGVQTFSVPHDAADPVGFVFQHGDAALGFLTDLGFATKLVHERVRMATTLVIETNHDSALLSADTRRPWSVKQRIMSRHGHLSNEAAASVIGQTLAGGGRLRRAVLGHLSRDCNRPDLALATMRREGGEGVAALELVCAAQGEMGAPLAIEPPPKPAPVVSSRVAEEPGAFSSQMDLFGAMAI
jgi:phosphoribosyl 1,2-cyclic phosphodiesterase